MTSGSRYGERRGICKRKHAGGICCVRKRAARCQSGPGAAGTGDESRCSNFQSNVAKWLRTGWAPAITHPPVDQAVCAGGSITLTVSAKGTAPLSHQWRKGNHDDYDVLKDAGSVSGAAAAALTITGVADVVAGSYYCAVGNACGLVTSDLAMLAVGPTAWYRDCDCDGCGAGPSGVGVVPAVPLLALITPGSGAEDRWGPPRG